MPDDLKQRFKAFVPKPEPAKLQSRDDLPEAVEQSVHVWNRETHKSEHHTVTVPIVRCSTERAACHDLKAVLRLAGAGKLAVSDKTYQPGEAAMKAVNAVLLGGDFYEDSAYGPYERSASSNPLPGRCWCRRAEPWADGSGWVDRGSEGAGRPAGQTWRSCGSAGRSTLLDELRRIDCIKGQTGKPAQPDRGSGPGGP
jgi:hypothetical protein